MRAQIFKGRYYAITACCALKMPINLLERNRDNIDILVDETSATICLAKAAEYALYRQRRFILLLFDDRRAICARHFGRCLS